MTETKSKKVVKKKKKKKKSFSNIIAKINTPTLRFIFGLIFALLALFTFVSFISYLFNWAEDQSLLTEDNLFTSVVAVKNLGGKLGLRWSEFLISKLFGLGAFVIPFFLVGMSVFCFKRGKINFLRLFFLSLMGAIVLSIACSYIFSFTSASAMFGEGAGGSYGYHLNQWLVDMTGNLGTGIIVFFLLILWIVLLNNKVVGWFSRWYNSLFTKKTETEIELPEEEMSGDETAEKESVDDGTELAIDTPIVLQGDEEIEIVSGSVKDEDSDTDEAASEEEGEEGEEGEGEEEPEVADKKKKSGFWSIFGKSGKKKEQDSVEEEEKSGDAAETETDAETETENDAETESETENGDSGIPPVEVIHGDASNPSEVLTDNEWKNRYDPRLSLCHYKLPDLSLLNTYDDQVNEVSREELENNNRKIVTALRNYKIGITKISARIGPTVTLYEIVPAPGVRVSQIKRLEEDIARSLAACGVRVVTLTGTNAIGIEVANEKSSIVSMHSVLSDAKFNSTKYDLPVAIGRTISNEVYSFDLAKMPHLLVAGATGQGKSVGLNAIITSLLYKKHPAELKFVLVDPKKVELSLYAPLEKHYLAKLPDSEDAIITDTKLVVYTLKSLCKLMDHRYDLLKMASVRNIKEYNEKFLSRKLNPYKGHEFMPYIVVIIDEFADLLMTAGREVEEPIARLAQLARAIGIHLVIATQRPTTNIITGTIKANFPARIAFRVISSIDSKTILDQTGANQLIGRGDMLISTGSTEPVRVQCAFVDTPEINRIAEFINSQPGFGSAYLLPEYVPEEGEESFGHSGGSVERDDLFKEAARLIVREQQGSTSMIQRKMNLGYNRAGRIMDQLEDAGIVGPPEGSKPRHVRITSLESLEDLLSNL